ncbi:unnamed protein product [Caenorhabditis bovis]|uniref:Tudor domain-containing protein n=1 Tax=Caenorhabditis bovis TaxID=2654633 RepID=A0A8S1FEL8_9PELO|nr:unnamed protein product [Caenorhabditis bovis]
MEKFERRNLARQVHAILSKCDKKGLTIEDLEKEIMTFENFSLESALADIGISVLQFLQGFPHKFRRNAVTKICNLNLKSEPKKSMDTSLCAEQFSKLPSPPFEAWKIGHACLIPVFADRKIGVFYRRAVVVDIDKFDKIIIVRQIDFGDVRGFKAEKLIPMPEIFGSIPCLAIKLRLQNFKIIDEQNFDTIQKENLALFQKMGTSLKFRPIKWLPGHDDENALLVKLFVNSSPDDVLKTLETQGKIQIL